MWRDLVVILTFTKAFSTRYSPVAQMQKAVWRGHGATSSANVFEVYRTYT
jgi:hypothetical protein